MTNPNPAAPEKCPRCGSDEKAQYHLADGPSRSCTWKDHHPWHGVLPVEPPSQERVNFWPTNLTETVPVVPPAKDGGASHTFDPPLGKISHDRARQLLKIGTQRDEHYLELCQYVEQQRELSSGVVPQGAEPLEPVSSLAAFDAKRFARIVTPERARFAAQRLIDSHFHSIGRERVHISVPVNLDDDDIVIHDFIKQSEAHAAASPADTPFHVCGKPMRFIANDGPNRVWSCDTPKCRPEEHDASPAGNAELKANLDETAKNVWRAERERDQAREALRAAQNVERLAKLIAEADDWWDKTQNKLVPDATWAECLALYIAPKLAALPPSEDPAQDVELPTNEANATPEDAPATPQKEAKLRLFEAENGSRMWKAEVLRMAEKLHRLAGTQTVDGYERALEIIAERLNSAEPAAQPSAAPSTRED